jgi:hypothetical protein
MVDTSSITFIILVVAVLTLTFKDLLFTTYQNGDEKAEAVAHHNDHTNNNEPLDNFDQHFKSNQNDYNQKQNNDEDDFFNDDHIVEKKIPTLKMKTNIPTMKFMFW